MLAFSISTKLTTKEYIKIMYLGLYKRPGFLLANILGLYYLTTVILDYLNLIEWYTGTPTYEILFGVFLLLAPSIIVFMAVQQFNSNKNLQNEILYSFNEDGFTCTGKTFKAEFLWAHILKQKELGKYLILYHDKKFGNFIDRTKLTTEQLEFIKLKSSNK